MSLFSSKVKTASVNVDPGLIKSLNLTGIGSSAISQVLLNRIPALSSMTFGRSAERHVQFVQISFKNYSDVFCIDIPEYFMDYNVHSLPRDLATYLYEYIFENYPDYLL